MKTNNCQITDIDNINGFMVQMIENPSGLEKTMQEKLVKELNVLTAAIFNKATPIEETWERTVGVDIVYLIKNQDEIVGYTTNDLMKLNGRKMNYFSSAFIKRDLQDHGLYHEINNIRFNTHPTDVIMTRTQTPIVISGFKRLCDENGFTMFPSGGLVPPDIMNIARAYDPNVNFSLVCKGVYGRALMDDTPEPRDDVRSMFNMINVNNGDGMILIGTK
ncbi:MAG: hypothetical protein ABIB43_03785 [archaeon]